MSGIENNGRGVMLYQVQYRFLERPTRAMLDRVRRRRLAGKPTPGVKVRMIRWRGGLSNGRAFKEGEAQQAGIVKLYGKPNLVLLDIDTRPAPSCEKIWRLSRLLDVQPRYIRIDRTRHGWHVVVCFNRRFTAIETVAIQSVLGSDLKRETYNLARVMSGKRSRRWNLLFERKL